MRIRFIRPWYGYKPGAEHDFPDGQANLMIRRGIIEQVVVDARASKPKRERLIPPAAQTA